MDNTEKTVADVYEIAKHNPVVYAHLYRRDIEQISMFDTLIAIVCALDDENQILKKNAMHMAQHAHPIAFVLPSA